MAPVRSYLCENDADVAKNDRDDARRLRRLLDRYTITHGRRFHLKDINPDDTGKLDSKDDAGRWLEYGLRRLTELQEKLYARSTWSLLLIFQAMDAAGKDSTIKHVMSGVNPQACQVYSFKAPSDEELRHDFLWRTTKCLPERGRIGIFNRSYYEETLVVRVHEELLERQRLPRQLVTREIWDQRFEDIRTFERHLHRNGTIVLKFFLHVSKQEQRRRLLERLEDPEKHWKFSLRDLEERKLWRNYAAAYNDMIRNTAAAHAPWHVVPADHKWFTRLVVAAAIGDAMDRLDLTLPVPDRSERRALAAARATLERKDV
jgi:PPK2 family polyphosphate:nucleotide phosphotransferase